MPDPALAIRRAILDRFRVDHGTKRLVLMRRQDVERIIGARPPFAARNWLKALRGLMAFAAATGLRDDDTTDAVRPPKARAGTFHTWSEDEIAAFESFHAPASRARLAFALLLYTAARRGDLVRFGRQNIRAGCLHYRQQKTGRALEIPLHPALLSVIENTPPDRLTFLLTAQGKPFTVSGFGNWFRDCCDAAGLPQCSAHGLRKAAARRLAEAGCSAHQIAAITGHKTLSEVQRYTAAAEQARMAAQAIRTVSRTQIGNRGESSGNP